MNTYLFLILVSLTFSSVFATWQWQMYNKTTYTTASFQCLLQNGVSNVGINVWAYNLIANASSQAQMAQEAQIPLIDIYIYLSPASPGNSPPSVPISQIVDYVNTNNISYTSTWLLLDYYGVYFSDPSKNQQYLLDFVAQAQAAGLNNVGIHANSGWWPTWFGSQSWGDPKLTSLPLIYMGYMSQDFSDWDQLKIGEWAQPYGKQFDPQATICSTDAFAVWRP